MFLLEKKKKHSRAVLSRSEAALRHRSYLFGIKRISILFVCDFKCKMSWMGTWGSLTFQKWIRGILRGHGALTSIIVLLTMQGTPLLTITFLGMAVPSTSCCFFHLPLHLANEQINACSWTDGLWASFIYSTSVLFSFFSSQFYQSLEYFDIFSSLAILTSPLGWLNDDMLST